MLEFLIQRSPVPPEKIYKIFGQRLAEAREVSKLTQAELGRRMNLSRASIANIEAGRQRILLHQLGEFAFALGLNSSVDLLPADLGMGLRGTSAGDTNQMSFTGSELSVSEQRLVADVVGLFENASEDN